MIKELINTIAGNALDRIGSFRVEEKTNGNVTVYSIYDRQTGKEIGKEFFIVRDGFVTQTCFYQPSSLRKKYLK